MEAAANASHEAYSKYSKKDCAVQKPIVSFSLCGWFFSTRSIKLLIRNSCILEVLGSLNIACNCSTKQTNLCKDYGGPCKNFCDRFHQVNVDERVNNTKNNANLYRSGVLCHLIIVPANRTTLQGVESNFPALFE